MKCRTLFALRLVLGLILVALGNGQPGGLGLLLQQIEAIGPRQWLNLMAGTLVTTAPFGQRIARSFSIHPVPPVRDGGAGEATLRNI